MISNRHKKILEILAGKESTSVQELAQQLNVTLVTIRSDLSSLARKGKIVRMHGSARLVEERVRQEYSFEIRRNINLHKKHRIGKVAASLVNSQDSILLDASTTVMSLAHELRKRDDLKDVTIIPTGLWTAIELMGCNDFNVLLPGGYLRHTTGSIIGLSNSEFFNGLIIKKAFLGAAGISMENGLTDTHLLEIDLKKFIINYVKEVIILVDGSKFSQTGIAAYAEINQVSKIITDSSAPAEEVERIEKTGVEVIIAA